MLEIQQARKLDNNVSEEDLNELKRLCDEGNKAFNNTLGNYRPIQEAIDEWMGVDSEKNYEMTKQATCKHESGVYICDNEYHRLPVIPRNGTMTFEHNNADDALATMKSILSNVKVNLTISWEVVE